MRPNDHNYFEQVTGMIWLTGCNGMLGRELAALLRKEGVAFIATGREVDVTDGNALLDYCGQNPFRFIVNCAAYTAVDNAEDDAENCKRLNAVAPANLARAAKQTGASLIHISTDYVFNGLSRVPYTESDSTDPCGMYGKTKRDGEDAVRALHGNHYILRTAWLYGGGGRNFVATMLRLMAEKETLAVVNDQTGSPTWTFDLAAAIVRIIRQDSGGRPFFGTYHFTNEGVCTWFDFACAIYRYAKELGILKNECIIQPCASDAFPSKVKRPAYSVLSKEKIKQTFKIDIPNWDVSLKTFLESGIS